MNLFWALFDIRPSLLWSVLWVDQCKRLFQTSPGDDSAVHAPR